MLSPDRFAISRAAAQRQYQHFVLFPPHPSRIYALVCMGNGQFYKNFLLTILIPVYYNMLMGTRQFYKYLLGLSVTNSDTSVLSADPLWAPILPLSGALTRHSQIGRGAHTSFNNANKNKNTNTNTCRTDQNCKTNDENYLWSESEKDSERISYVCMLAFQSHSWFSLLWKIYLSFPSRVPSLPT